MSLDELQKMNPFTFKENNGTEFKGNNIVISDVMSKKYNLKINDKLKLDFGYASAEFSVYAIANNNGPFYDNLQNFTAVVPYDTLIKTRSFDNGDLNAAFLKVNEGVDVDKTIEDLKKVYSDYSVTASYNKEEIENQVMPISSALMFMSLLVILLTVFIIHTVFGYFGRTYAGHRQFQEYRRKQKKC
jgi:ABC-type lipoprotein release transport system permease subunit